MAHQGGEIPEAEKDRQERAAAAAIWQVVDLLITEEKLHAAAIIEALSLELANILGHSVDRDQVDRVKLRYLLERRAQLIAEATFFHYDGRCEHEAGRSIH
jgi:hypothetical protein